MTPIHAPLILSDSLNSLVQEQVCANIDSIKGFVSWLNSLGTQELKSKECSMLGLKKIRFMKR